MSKARSGHDAYALPSGEILVVGGDESHPITAEIYDWRTNSWRAAAAPTRSRTEFVGAALPDGRVVIAGGTSDSFPGQLNDAEIYTPETDAWQAAGTVSGDVFDRAAWMLAISDREVMLSAVDGPTQIFDADTKTWSSFTGCVAGVPLRVDAGRVMLLAYGRTSYLDLASRTCLAGPDTVVPRSGATATVLHDGRTLVTGGTFGSLRRLSSTELLAGPVITGSTPIVPAALSCVEVDGCVWAARQDGRRHDDDTISSAAVSSDGAVAYVVGTDGPGPGSDPELTVSSVDSSTGQFRWVRRLASRAWDQNEIAGDVVVSEDGSSVYVSWLTRTAEPWNGGRVLSVISAFSASGQELWTHAAGEDLGPLDLTLSEDGSALYFAGGSRVARLELSGRSIAWTTSVAGTAATVKAVDDRVFVGGYGHSAMSALVTSLDAGTGTIEWTFQDSAPNYTLGPLEMEIPSTGNSIYIAGPGQRPNDDRLGFRVSALDRDDGRRRWVRHVEADSVTQRALEVTPTDSHVLLMTSNLRSDLRIQRVMAMDAETGDTLWQDASLPRGSSWDMALAPNGFEVFVAVRDGKGLSSFAYSVATGTLTRVSSYTAQPQDYATFMFGQRNAIKTTGDRVLLFGAILTGIGPDDRLIVALTG